MTKPSLAGLSARQDATDAALAQIIGLLQQRNGDTVANVAAETMQTSPATPPPAVVNVSAPATPPPATTAAMLLKLAEECGDGEAATTLKRLAITEATQKLASAATQNGNAGPIVPLLSNLEHFCDNTSRKIKVKEKQRNQETGEETEKLVEKTLLLRDSTRQIVYPLMQQQVPVIQLQLVLNGNPTGTYVNLKCGKSKAGSLQYSADKQSLVLPIVDSAGQHATIDVSTPAGIYFQANQVTAYPMKK